ncbi:MAG: DUF3326 domain-containing protein [Planctomycetota bacterium]|jgi:hypothetical protein
MLLIEQEIDVPVKRGKTSLLKYFEDAIGEHLQANEIPVRFVVTESNDKGYHCELGVLAGLDDFGGGRPGCIFEFVPRGVANGDRFNAVMIVPTGIGAEIGGHAGDAGPAARLLAAACDTLITHPNVVNASDINELPENGLYVEGSVISGLLMGAVGLEKVRSNRVMLVIDKHKDKRIAELTVNAASAARASLGLECPLVVELEPGVKMRARYSTSGSAVGRVEGLERLCEVLQGKRNDYDAVALASVIDVPKEFHMEYFERHGEMVNPWGGVEAMLTHAVTMLFGVPAAHSPMFESMEVANLDVGVVDPRMSAEAVSMCFLHSVLKGLHRSPRIISDKMLFGHPGVLTAADVSCLVIPDGCIGLPTLAALEQGIPVIAVRENRNRMENNLERLPFGAGKLFIVDNYLEAVGMMTALKAGVAPSSVRRPLAETSVTCERTKMAAGQGSPVDDGAAIAEKSDG